MDLPSGSRGIRGMSCRKFIHLQVLSIRPAASPADWRIEWEDMYVSSELAGSFWRMVEKGDDDDDDQSDKEEEKEQEEEEEQEEAGGTRGGLRGADSRNWAESRSRCRGSSHKYQSNKPCRQDRDSSEIIHSRAQSTRSAEASRRLDEIIHSWNKRQLHGRSHATKPRRKSQLHKRYINLQVRETTELL